MPARRVHSRSPGSAPGSARVPSCNSAEFTVVISAIEEKVVVHRKKNEHEMKEKYGDGAHGNIDGLTSGGVEGIGKCNEEEARGHSSCGEQSAAKDPRVRECSMQLR